MGDRKYLQDYTMVCRTCLQANVEMCNLSGLINDNVQDESPKISYWECLKKCIQIEELDDIKLPQKICLECASALQVAYWFVKNATQAQELLKLKLREIKRKKQQLKEEEEMAIEKFRKPKRYRCKICNVKVETKRSLKDHVKLHLDIIIYNCQLCSFESNNRNGLCDHYTQAHGMEASKEQLKPKTKTSFNSSMIPATITSQDQMATAIKNEHFQIVPEYTQQQSCEAFTTNTSFSNGPLQLSEIATKSHSNVGISESFTALDVDLNSVSTNDLSIANEFMVMADGSLEKVMNKGVVIEYINASENADNLTLGNDLVLDNIIQVQNIDNSLMIEPQSDIVQMDVDDLIIEDPGDVIEEAQESIPSPLDEEIIPVTIIEQPKKIACKICFKEFTTQEYLKNHMLTHNEIPHFFCDQCTFYTFFKIDLQQHYRSKHNLHPTYKQLQPKNKQKAQNESYACNLCFYESNAKLELKRHYKIKHNIETNEIHLKLNRVERTNTKTSPNMAKTKADAMSCKATTTKASKNIKIRSIEQSIPDYPNGLNCRKCHEVFFWRNKLYEHYKLHNAEEAARKQEKQLMKVQNKPTTTLNLNKTKPVTKAVLAQTQTVPSAQNGTNTLTYSGVDTLTTISVGARNSTAGNSIASLNPSTSSTYTLPSDAIPQIVETELTIDNDMNFDFIGDDDALFGDFDDDVDVENDSDDNDNEFRKISLTSDDELEDLLQEKDSSNNINDDTATSTTATNGSFCAHCQKSFFSQYQFENHMFVHRGLAPYRCEMCTNLYNTKRCLIRHYKAVHKSVPTRDMIQAKGDKVYGDTTLLPDIKLEETTSLMCAKCPYESSELNDIKLHLHSSHNISDESFIMKKLPYECPRCIRSFASKMKVLRHLELNHSSTPINQHQMSFESEENAVTASSLAATTTTTTTTTINNKQVNMMKTESIETNASCGHNDISVKQRSEQQDQTQQHSYTNVTKNKISIEDAVAPSAILAHFQDTITTTSSTASVAYNENFSNSSDNTPMTTPTALDDNPIELPLFKCKICLFTCYNLESFNEHSKRIDCRKYSTSNPGIRTLFECEICHCNYKTMYLLKHHLKRHIGRKFLCESCPKTFINKVELEIHKHVHSGERPHKCDACTKSFRYHHHLKRHKDSVHFGKRHACAVPNCERKFTTLAQLKVHIWTHNGIVPYKCPFCNRLFKKRLLLREHCLKIHNVNVSEEEMAEIFRTSLGYTNPHDFTVTIGNGKMLRRADLETMGASGVIKSSFK